MEEIIVEKEAPKKKKKLKNKREKPVLTEEQIKKKKARKTRIAFASFVLILGVGIMGNWYYENSDISSTVKPIFTSFERTKTLGEAEYVGATTSAQNQESEYFSSARIERQSSRDSALEKLQAVIDNTEEGEKAKEKAAESIARLSSNISAENKIETLVLSKGVNNCLAVVSEDGKKVDIIVDVEELSDSIIMQIKDIAISQLGCSFENVSIIKSK